MEKVLKNCDWVDEVLDTYNSGLKEIRVRAKGCGHICLVTTKSLTRKDAVKSCPQCREERKTFLKTKRYCKNCGKELKTGQEHFCSRSCSAIFYNNPESRALNNADGILNSKKCLNCGKIIANYKKFCSRDCMNDYNRKEKEQKLKDQSFSKSKSDGRPSKVTREYLFKKFNNSCEICGWNTVNKFTGKVPLQIHHKDGDPTNNELSNLQLLCPNCHSLTRSYGNKNYGKGRESRRVRRWKNNTNN